MCTAFPVPPLKMRDETRTPYWQSCGSGMFIPDPGSDFSIPDPGWVKKIPDPGSGSASKYLSIFIPKNCFEALGNMIEDVHPGSVSWIQILDPGVKKTPDPGSESATLPTGLLP
jgi:hypothetical protein